MLPGRDSRSCLDQMLASLSGLFIQQAHAGITLDRDVLQRLADMTAAAGAWLICDNTCAPRPSYQT